MKKTLAPLFAAMLFAACTVGAAPAARQPNVIYIFADDLGYGEIGAFGQKIIKTPTLDRLAAEGMRFTNHYVGQPVCAPSRAQLMTGKDSGHAAIRGNRELGGYPAKEELGQQPLPEDSVTVGTIFQRAGYKTAIVGKWGLGGFNGKGLPKNLGFDHSFGYLDQQQAHNFYPTHLWKDGQRYPLDNPAFSAHQKFPKDKDPNDPRSYEQYKGKQYSLDLMADDALEFIQANKDRPFFLYFAPTTPHVALQVPDEELKQYEQLIPEANGPYLGDRGYIPHQYPRRAYAAMVTRMDRHIGRIMDLLKKLGLDDNTLVMFASDNGPTYVSGVDVKYFDSTAGLRGLKDQVYEGGIRTPMIARWPARIPAGRTSALLSGTIDILPTMAELTGQAAPQDIQGISMLSELTGKAQKRQHAWLYFEHHDSKGQQAVRMGDWKAVRIGVSGKVDAPIELYNLRTDPAESRDVASQHPDVVAQIRMILAKGRVHSLIPEWNFGRSQ